MRLQMEDYRSQWSYCPFLCACSSKREIWEIDRQVIHFTRTSSNIDFSNCVFWNRLDTRKRPCPIDRRLCQPAQSYLLIINTHSYQKLPAYQAPLPLYSIEKMAKHRHTNTLIPRFSLIRSGARPTLGRTSRDASDTRV